MQSAGELLQLVRSWVQVCEELCGKARAVRQSYGRGRSQCCTSVGCRALLPIRSCKHCLQGMGCCGATPPAML